jgi:hypothetical protein
MAKENLSWTSEVGSTRGHLRKKSRIYDVNEITKFRTAREMPVEDTHGN